MILGRLGRFPLSICQLLFRLAIAGVFLRAGLTKMASWETTVQLFTDEYKVPVFPPEIAALLATTFELGCSTLLVVGLATRLATLPLLGMIAVIQLFVYPHAWSEHLTWVHPPLPAHARPRPDLARPRPRPRTRPPSAVLGATGASQPLRGIVLAHPREPCFSLCAPRGARRRTKCRRRASRAATRSEVTRAT
jgi:putative oxidoreductase